MIMNDLQELAKAAKQASPDCTVDDICQYILDGVKSQQRFIELANDSFARIMATDYEKIFTDYAASINKQSLTVEEKLQAFLKHILK